MALIETRRAKNGKVSYRARVRLRGFPEYTQTFPRKTDADLWAKAKEADLKRGFHVASKEAARRTLAEAIDRYIEHTLPHKQRNKDADKVRQILGRWKQELGGVAVSNVTPARIVEVRDRLQSEKTYRGRRRSGSTVNRYLHTLSSVFKTAMREWQWCDRNPLSLISKGTESRGVVRFLSDDERNALLKACKASAAEYLYALVLLALTTGARRGELLALTWDDVDLNKVQIVVQESKNGERRALPLAGPVLALLRERSKVRRLHNSRVFPGNKEDKPLDIDDAWQKALKAAGIENFRFHDLRHSAASYLAMSGATPGEIAAVLGHKTLAMVKRYAHLSEQHTAGVVQRMANKFLPG
ncbi:MAG: site-specific integrase [Pseudomonadota bacterium]